MTTIITITNGGGSSQPVRVTNPAGQAALVFPGQESQSFIVPEDGELRIGEEKTYLTPIVPPEPDPTVATVKHGDTVEVRFADGVTEAEGSPATAVVEEGTLSHVELTV